MNKRKKLKNLLVESEHYPEDCGTEKDMKSELLDDMITLKIEPQDDNSTPVDPSSQGDDTPELDTSVSVPTSDTLPKVPATPVSTSITMVMPLGQSSGGNTTMRLPIDTQNAFVRLLTQATQAQALPGQRFQLIMPVQGQGRNTQLNNLSQLAQASSGQRIQLTVPMVLGKHPGTITVSANTNAETTNTIAPIMTTSSLISDSTSDTKLSLKRRIDRLRPMTDVEAKVIKTPVVQVRPIAPATRPQGRMFQTTAFAGESDDGHKACNCTKSHCLKLYCECFAQGVTCSRCNCTNCMNNDSHAREKDYAIRTTLERNPLAFQSKIDKYDGDKKQHVRGCNCKKSGCLKNYCECYEAKIFCSSLCRCKDCHNYEGGSICVRSFTRAISPNIGTVKNQNGVTRGNVLSPSSSLSSSTSCQETPATTAKPSSTPTASEAKRHCGDAAQEPDKLGEATNGAVPVTIPDVAIEKSGRLRSAVGTWQVPSGPQLRSQTNGVASAQDNRRRSVSSEQEDASSSEQIDESSVQEVDGNDTSADYEEGPPSLGALLVDDEPAPDVGGPGEEDFTEEELALMQRMRERSALETKSQKEEDMVEVKEEPLDYDNDSNDDATNKRDTIDEVAEAVARGRVPVKLRRSQADKDQSQGTNLLDFLSSSQRQIDTALNRPYFVNSGGVVMATGAHLQAVRATDSNSPVLSSLLTQGDEAQAFDSMTLEDYVQRHIKAAAQAVGTSQTSGRSSSTATLTVSSSASKPAAPTLMLQSVQVSPGQPPQFQLVSPPSASQPPQHQPPQPQPLQPQPLQLQPLQPEPPHVQPAQPKRPLETDHCQLPSDVMMMLAKQGVSLRLLRCQMTRMTGDLACLRREVRRQRREVVRLRLDRQIASRRLLKSSTRSSRSSARKAKAGVSVSPVSRLNEGERDTINPEPNEITEIVSPIDVIEPSQSTLVNDSVVGEGESSEGPVLLLKSPCAIDELNTEASQSGINTESDNTDILS